MKTICGMSVRGVAYFGASVHICIGVLYFGFLLQRLINHVYVNSQSLKSLNLNKENVIYFGLFLPLGVLIFKAIDKENKTLLKWATAAFLALHLFGMIIRVKYGLAYSTGAVIKYSNLTSQYVQHSQQIFVMKTLIDTYIILAMELILTLTYFVSLCIYGRTLYSTNSSTHFLPSDQHSGHHGNRLLSGSPFFQPPPLYSRVNNPTGITTADDHQNGQGHQDHHPSGQIPTAPPLSPLQQPCRSVFANIGRIFGSKNKSSPSSVVVGSGYHHHHSNHHLGPVTSQQSQPSVNQPTGGVNATLVAVTTPNHHNSSIDNQISNESDSPNTTLLENHKRTSQDSSHHRNINNTTGGVGGRGSII